MKNRNKYLNLANGMALLAINNSSIIFTLVGAYGLMMIRDFTIKEQDGMMKSKTEALLALSIVRGIISFLGATAEDVLISYSVIFLNAVIFILTFMLLKNALRILSEQLSEYGLDNIKSKIKVSFNIIVGIDAFLLSIILLLLVTTFLPNPLFINIISIFLHPRVNLLLGLMLTLVKYFAAIAFTKAGLMLNQANSY